MPLCPERPELMVGLREGPIIGLLLGLIRGLAIGLAVSNCCELLTAGVTTCVYAIGLRVGLFIENVGLLAIGTGGAAA